MKNELCDGVAPAIWQESYKRIKKLTYWETLRNRHAYTGIKRIRMECPKCGRRLLSSISNTEDGDLVHSLPPHKPKGWWKKKTIKRRKERI